MDTRAHILLLGGSAEAFELAELLVPRQELRITTSLAGATRSPRAVAGELRRGGFGGVEGLSRWLEEQRVALVLDASHPFATRISVAARSASARTGTAYLRLERPPWQPGAGERWESLPDLEAALAALSPGSERVFAAIGGRWLGRLGEMHEIAFVLRGVDEPAVVPANVTFVAGRGPFDPAKERQLFERHGIDTLLCRNSGGSAGRAKLDAARKLGLRVVMIERPGPPLPGSVADVATALVRIGERLR